MTPGPRLFIADPNLETIHGHYLGYAMRIAAAAADLGVTPVILANRAASIPDGMDLRPTLLRNYWQEMTPADGGDPFEHLAISARLFAETMQATLLDADVGSGDVLFLPYANLVETQGMAILAHRMDTRLPRIVFLFRRELEEQAADTHLDRRTVTALLRDAFGALSCCAVRTRIRVLTDSDELSGDYEEALRRRVQTAPIPVDSRWGHEVPPPAVRSLLYLGDARTEKGYHLLPALARAQRVSLSAGTLRLVLQSNLNVPGGEPGIRDAREALSSMPGVELLESALTDDEYGRRLGSASLVLLPYQPSRYVARTSGILAEAIVAGIPAIVPGGTWLSHQVRRFGAGASFDGTIDGLVRTVDASLAQLEVLRAQARDRSHAFAAFHNPSRLASFVCGVDVLAAASRVHGSTADGRLQEQRC